MRLPFHRKDFWPVSNKKSPNSKSLILLDIFVDRKLKSFCQDFFSDFAVFQRSLNHEKKENV